MPLRLDNVERALRSKPGLKVLYDEKHELSFETAGGRQIAVNRQSSAKAVRLWIENKIDPRTIGLSSEAEITHYPATKPRAHLSAPNLTGPYKTRGGNECWYIAIRSEDDLNTLLSAYL